ncbi:MAG: ComF family protein [Bacteroidota bacterium]
MTLFNDFLSLIYPRHCAACSNVLIEQEKFICLSCENALPRGHHDITGGKAVHEVLAARVPLIHAHYLFNFEKSGKIQNLIHAIKYNGQKELATYLGEILGKEFLKNKVSFDLIVPIPLHPKKIKKRGFNQSAHFGNGIAKTMGNTMMLDNLIRAIETPTQTKKKKYQRWENVEGIFQLQDFASMQHKHVLLVDDVVTTGATIEAAWQALKEVEGIQISVAAIAFAKKA